MLDEEQIRKIVRDEMAKASVQTNAPRFSIDHLIDEAHAKKVVDVLNWGLAGRRISFSSIEGRKSLFVTSKAIAAFFMIHSEYFAEVIPGHPETLILALGRRGLLPWTIEPSVRMWPGKVPGAKRGVLFDLAPGCGPESVVVVE